ncbi:MAG: hypothetical protein ACLFN8_04210 [Candidatus Woesearchaeota archaeon]
MIEKIKNFTKKTYASFNQIKKAYGVMRDEKSKNLDLISCNLADYALSSDLLKYEQKQEIKLQTKLKKTANQRLYDNIIRSFKGKKLLQEQEREEGIEFKVRDYPRLMVLETDKCIEDDKQYEQELEKLNNQIINLENKLKQQQKYNTTFSKDKREVIHEKDIIIKILKEKAYNSNNKSTNLETITNNYITNTTKKDIITKVHAITDDEYLKSFNKNSFTYKIAQISKKNTGAVKNAADVLAGYVQTNDGGRLAPVNRGWAQRINELEQIIDANKFDKKNVDELVDLIDAISQNKYLRTKKTAQYKRAVELINKAIEGAYAKK